jgi:hypothetical protein
VFKPYGSRVDLGLNIDQKHNNFKAGVLRDMRIGVLTGGGDCPGLNAVIRGVVRKGVKEYGYEFIGFKDGWRGVLKD